MTYTFKVYACRTCEEPLAYRMHAGYACDNGHVTSQSDVERTDRDPRDPRALKTNARVRHERAERASEAARAAREIAVSLTLAEVGDVRRGGGHEFGSATVYRHTERRDGDGELTARYESVTALMARLAGEGWEPVSVVPDETGTWVTVYVRREAPRATSRVAD